MTKKTYCKKHKQRFKRYLRGCPVCAGEVFVMQPRPEEDLPRILKQMGLSKLTSKRREEPKPKRRKLKRRKGRD